MTYAGLAAALRRKPCRTFTSDLRVRILETGLSTYRRISSSLGVRLDVGAIDANPLGGTATA